jgi:hypothetical protein
VNDTIYTSYNSAEALKKALLGKPTVVAFPATNPLEPVHPCVDKLFTLGTSILVPVNAPAAAPAAVDGVNVPDVVAEVGFALIVTGKSQIFPNAAVVE